MFVPYFPCTDCARGIAQSGIATVVTVEPDYDPEFIARWGEDFRISLEILTESNVTVRYY